MFLNKLSKFKQRLIISLCGVVIVLFSITFANQTVFKPVFTLLTAVTACFALWEYYHIAHGKGYTPLTKLGIAASAGYIYANFFGIDYPVAGLVALIILWVTLISSFGFYFFAGKDPFANLAITFFGIIYLTIPLSLVLNITYYFPEGSAQDGRWWLLYLLLITKITDTGAYFVGKQFGATKMVPYISPQKTWEGAAGGFITAVLTATIFYLFVHITFEKPPIALGYFSIVLTAAVISLLGQFGDLAESLLKRDVGVKDSSHLPGLGGILDVVDSVVFTCPFIYFILKLSY